LEVPGSVEKGKELGEEGKQHEKKRKMKKAHTCSLRFSNAFHLEIRITHASQGV